MFYAAEALLLSRGFAFSKHSAVIAAFGRYIVKTGILPPESHELLRTAFDERNIGDYEAARPYPREKAESLLKEAKRFVDGARRLLEGGMGPRSGDVR